MADAREVVTLNNGARVVFDPMPIGAANNVLVDGASHYSKWRGAARTFNSGYGLESIKEVQVLTSQFSAEYGVGAVPIAMMAPERTTHTT